MTWAVLWPCLVLLVMTLGGGALVGMIVADCLSLRDLRQARDSY